MPRKVKAQAKPRKRTIPKKQAQNLLSRVPEEYIFWCCDGTVFRDMKELAGGLATMSDDAFTHHVTSEKNDFYNWVRDVIRDEELAGDLAKAITRLQAVTCVTTRLDILTGIVT